MRATRVVHNGRMAVIDKQLQLCLLAVNGSLLEYVHPVLNALHNKTIQLLYAGGQAAWENADRGAWQPSTPGCTKPEGAAMSMSCSCDMSWCFRPKIRLLQPLVQS